jgi:hypothetical protein
MNTTYESRVPISGVLQQSKSLSEFKIGVSDLLEKRSYFVSQVLPKLKENADYYITKGRKSLSKGGAEKLCSIYNLSATFEKDNETMLAFSGIPGLIAYTCTLSRNGVVIGQGRGCSTLSKCDGDPNKAIKMAEKSSYISATIRTTGLSDIFTADLEDISLSVITKIPDKEEFAVISPSATEEPAITKKQEILLRTLIFKIGNQDTRADFLHQLENGLSRGDASEMISSLLPTY